MIIFEKLFYDGIFLWKEESLRNSLLWAHFWKVALFPSSSTSTHTKKYGCLEKASTTTLESRAACFRKITWFLLPVWGSGVRTKIQSCCLRASYTLHWWNHPLTKHSMRAMHAKKFFLTYPLGSDFLMLGNPSRYAVIISHLIMCMHMLSVCIAGRSLNMMICLKCHLFLLSEISFSSNFKAC